MVRKLGMFVVFSKTSGPWIVSLILQISSCRFQDHEEFGKVG